MRNDSAFVYLPYMGRVYQPVMNDDGLRFALPAKDVKTRDVGDKGKRVEFSVRNLEFGLGKSNFQSQPNDFSFG